MIIVTGSLTARADTLDPLLALSLAHVQRSRAEPGCLEHGVAIDAQDSRRLFFFERWADRETLAVHFKVPASRDFAKQVAGLVASPPTLEMYDATLLPGR